MGNLIVIEGCEGSGKSTQAKNIVNWLKEKDSVYQARFPGGTKIGEIIRDCLLHSEEKINKIAELLLYKADEAHHIDIIKEKLLEGHVVSDRFCYSTIAYQGYGRGIDLETIHQLNAITTQRIVVDVLFIMNMPIDIGLERSRKASGRFDRFESLDLEFHRRVGLGYQSLLQDNHPDYLAIKYGYGKAKKIVEINANRDINVVFEEIKSHL